MPRIRDLKTVIEIACWVDWGRIFHFLVVDGKKELDEIVSLE